MKTFKTGKYIPQRPEKYKGDVDNIVFRSSWELFTFRFIDNNENILYWAAEPFYIPYHKPGNPPEKLSRYYPDLWVMVKTKCGKIIQEVIEIKPSNQTKPSTRRNAKTRMMENYVVNINHAKWDAARKWCEDRSMNFRILTEHDLAALK